MSMFINAISCNCKKFEHTASFVYKKTLGIPRMSAVLGASYNHGVNHLKGYVFFYDIKEDFNASRVNFSFPKKTQKNNCCPQ